MNKFAVPTANKLVSQKVERIIPIAEMVGLTGKTAKSLWRWHAKEGTFPKPIMQKGRALGWKESAYNEWLAEREGV